MPTLNAGRKIREILNRDTLAAMEGRLGLSEQEREQGAMSGADAAARQAAAQQTDVQRASMAGGAAPFSGEAAKLQRDIAGKATEGAAIARAAQDQISAQIAAARREALLAQLRQQQQVAQQRAAMAMELGGQVLEAGATAAAPGLGALFTQMASEAPGA